MNGHNSVIGVTVGLQCLIGLMEGLSPAVFSILSHVRAVGFTQIYLALLFGSGSCLYSLWWLLMLKQMKNNVGTLFISVL